MDMYHSHLLVNVGDNPDRPDWKICRRWLRNLYRVHQRLCMAFPSGSNGGAVHRSRSAESGFLFRIDYPVNPGCGARMPVILVQSANPPDWNRAFGLSVDDERMDELGQAEPLLDARGRPVGNAGFLLAAPPQVRRVSIEADGDELVLSSPKQNHRIAPGDLVRFRLRANPTRKVDDGSHNGKRKRINPTLEDHAGWLVRKLADATASPLCIERFVPGWAYGWRTKYEPEGSQRMQWWSVLLEGKFRLKDPAALSRLLESGIGSAKGFGFGLLSIAKV